VYLLAGRSGHDERIDLSGPDCRERRLGLLQASSEIGDGAAPAGTRSGPAAPGHAHWAVTGAGPSPRLWSTRRVSERSPTRRRSGNGRTRTSVGAATISSLLARSGSR